MKALPRVLLAAATALSLSVGALHAQTTLIDTITNATNFSSATAPHTYIGDGFSNNALPASTTQFQVTGGSVALSSATATTYVDIVLRIQLWNTVDPNSTTAVFSNPAASISVDYGGATLAAGASYILPFTLSGILPTLTGGNGHNFGVTINFQASTTTGVAVSDNTNLSPAIAYNTRTTGATGYAAGTITTGASPNFGYYRNVESQTNFNFIAGDARDLGVTYQGVGLRLVGNPVVSTVPEPSTWALLGVGVVGASVMALRRRQAVRG